MDKQRRTSLGKSTFIDIAISSIFDIQNSGGDIQSLVSLALDKNLINEIRSVAWRIFLGILPAKTPEDWVTKTKQFREFYESELTRLSNECKFIDGLLSIGEAQNLLKTNTLDLLGDFNVVIKEESKKSMIYNSLSESAQKIYLAWFTKSDNSGLSKEQIKSSFLTLLTLMFALYPSMIHVSAEESDIPSVKSDTNLPAPKDLLYFLSSEDYFDHDIYAIFCEIMEKGLKKLISYNHTNKTNDLFDKVTSVITKGKQVAEVLKDEERCTTDFYFYLNVCNKELVTHLAKDCNNLDLSSLIHALTSSLFYGLDVEHLIYVWDCILVCENNINFDFTCMNKQQTSLNFVDFLACVLISNTDPKVFEKKELSTCDVFNNLKESDFKVIIEAALKLREKVTFLYEEN